MSDAHVTGPSVRLISRQYAISGNIFITAIKRRLLPWVLCKAAYAQDYISFGLRVVSINDVLIARVSSSVVPPNDLAT